MAIALVITVPIKRLNAASLFADQTTTRAVAKIINEKFLILDVVQNGSSELGALGGADEGGGASGALGGEDDAGTELSDMP